MFIDKKYSFFYFIILSLFFASDPDHLIFTKISILPDQAEMIQIYNPRSVDVDLTNYYLSDATDSDDDIYYYNLPLGQNYWDNNPFDFIVKFPEGFSISSQDTLIISIQSKEEFYSYYGYESDLSFVDGDMTSNLGEEDESTMGTLLSSGALADSKEMLILFYWDGESELIQDVDYFLWGDDTYGISKTMDDGYNFNDTPIDEQSFIRSYGSTDFSDSLYVRQCNSELGESIIEGNGITGHDETSENFQLSWNVVGYDRFNSFEDILDGDYDCEYSSSDACPLGSVDCSIINIKGVLVDYFDVTVHGGPHAIKIEDDLGYRLELTVWPETLEDAEPFTDNNENGYYDFAEEFIDEGNGIYDDGEVFIDCNEDLTLCEDAEEWYCSGNFGNGIWDLGEVFTDEGNGIYDEGEVFFDCNENGTICNNDWDWIDGMGNNQWDAAEPFVDLNGNENWDDSGINILSNLITPPFYQYIVQAQGQVFEWEGEKQIQICDLEYLQIIGSNNMEGIFEQSEDYEKAVITPAPYVLVPTEDEVLDYSYGFPSNSRVIIRVFDISGRFITTLVDQYYSAPGIVRREEQFSSWDGRNHLGQILSPGTYLFHMETTNYQTGETSYDIAPVVIGVRNK